VTFITANVVAADTDAEAHARALPQVRTMARLRGGLPLRALETVEEATDRLAAPVIEKMSERWFIGTGPDVRARLETFAATHGVDEVMISPVAGSFAAEPLDTTLGRTQTVDLLAR
jgi:alkanesulfonate monooxygenase SsuD/methylene tetrahydromethanopterin reductase-like flavin-dependent oxidoreductase (luciferase family)